MQSGRSCSITRHGSKRRRQAVAMEITGHKTLSVYQRYRIVSESDIRDALEKTQAALASNGESRKVATIVAQKEAVR